MAYQIYSTEGIILKKKDTGEADRLFWIYTEQFGMIMASAKSARLEKSKLRPGLSLFTYGCFSLISSRNFWKIVDARDILLPKITSETVGSLNVFSKIGKLLERMINGEDRNELLWLELRCLFVKLFGGKEKLDRDKLNDLEIRSVAEILKTLGYVSEIPSLKKEILHVINKAIKESML